MLPRSKIGGGAYCFCPVCLVCHSVILCETLTVLITFVQWVLELWYLHEYSLWEDLSLGTIFFTLRPWPWSLTHFFFIKLNLAYKFWTVSARVLIFHMSIPYDKTFLWFHYFSINIRNFVLQMSIFCDIVDCPRDLDHKHILFSFFFRFAVITACNHLITCIWIIISRYIDCIRICMGLYTLRPIVLL